MSSPAPSQPILDHCLDAGFAAAGVALAEASRHESSLNAWLESGRHGEMAWLERNIDVRIDPRQLLPNARSVIVVADRYGASDVVLPPRSGRIARYARGRDYHTHMKGDFIRCPIGSRRRIPRRPFGRASIRRRFSNVKWRRGLGWAASASTHCSSNPRSVLGCCSVRS